MAARRSKRSRCPKSRKRLDITTIVTVGARRRLIRSFAHDDLSVRVLAKQMGLNATGVEDVIRTAVRA